MAIDYDNIGPAQFVAAAQEYFLRQSDGSLSAERANAPRLQGFLFAMLVQLGEAQGAIEKIPKSVGTIIPRGRLLIEVQGVSNQLLHMIDITNSYIERGMLTDTGGALYYCVTAPLLLGWHGNADCSDIDPKQKGRRGGVAGLPVRIMRQAEALGEFEASQGIGVMTKYLLESTVDFGENAVEIATNVAKALEKKIKDVAKEVIGSQAIVTAIGLSILGIGAVVYYGGKRR